MVIGQELLVSNHPISADQVQGGRQTQGLKHLLGDLGVIHWRYFVEVVHHVLLNTVKNDNSRRGNGEEDWDSESKEESDEDNKKHGRITVMDHMIDSSIELNVVLDTGLFCVIL